MKSFLCFFIGIPTVILAAWGVLEAGSWLTRAGYWWVNLVLILAVVSAVFAALLDGERA